MSRQRLRHPKISQSIKRYVDPRDYHTIDASLITMQCPPTQCTHSLNYLHLETNTRISSSAIHSRLPQIMQHQQTKQEKHDNPRPENPLILLRPSLHHPYRVPTDTKGIRHIIQPPLRPLQYLALVSQIAQNRTAPIEKLV
jgi:hypothetical protein